MCLGLLCSAEEGLPSVKNFIKPLNRHFWMEQLACLPVDPPTCLLTPGWGYVLTMMYRWYWVGGCWPSASQALSCRYFVRFIHFVLSFRFTKHSSCPAHGETWNALWCLYLCTLVEQGVTDLPYFFPGLLSPRIGFWILRLPFRLDFDEVGNPCIKLCHLPKNGYGFPLIAGHLEFYPGHFKKHSEKPQLHLTFAPSFSNNFYHDQIFNPLHQTACKRQNQATKKIQANDAQQISTQSIAFRQPFHLRELPHSRSLFHPF